MTAYGQTSITEDLYAARDNAGGQIIDEAEDVKPHDLVTEKPFVMYFKNGQEYKIGALSPVVTAFRGKPKFHSR